MPFAEDLATFFQAGDFAHAATWSAAPAEPVLGIFDKEYSEPFGQVVSSRPVFLTRAAALPGIAEGQTLTIDAVAYTIREFQPDGTGLLLVTLNAP
jgi:hypothetical protein